MIYGSCLTNFTIFHLYLVSYFETVILKVESPFHLGEFRPISVEGSLCKFVAKVLATTFGLGMEKYVSPNQLIFLKGVMMLDGVVVVDEVINLSKRSKKVCLNLNSTLRKRMIQLVRNL